MRVFCNFLIVRCRDFAPSHPPHNTTTTHQQRAACVFSAFWLRAGEYYGGSDADARGENLENLRAMLAESDDDEELPS